MTPILIPGAIYKIYIHKFPDIKDVLNADDDFIIVRYDGVTSKSLFKFEVVNYSMSNIYFDYKDLVHLSNPPNDI